MINLVGNTIMCLNPYFDGSISVSREPSEYTATDRSLNPYFDGSISVSMNTISKETLVDFVLILILMEVSQ